MSFQQWPLWLNAGLFAVAAAGVWLVGARLERTVDALAVRTGLGHAMAGLVLLAAATSLPEIATTTAATLAGNAELAVHNLFGTIPANLLILVLADALVGSHALTAFAPRFDLLTEGLGVVVLLALGGMALIVEGGPGTIRLNVPLLVVPVAYLVLVRLIYRSRRHPRWSPEGIDEVQRGGQERAPLRHSAGRLWWAFAALALLMFGCGWLLASLADALAGQTGLGAGLVGVVLLGLATSLPEISTTTSAVRHGNATLAISNILGSCLFTVVLLFPLWLLSSGPVVSAGSTGVVFMTVLGITMTVVYLWGLLEHRDSTVFRIGVDSLVVLVLYLAGIAALYGIERGSRDSSAGQGSAAPVVRSDT